MKLAIIAPDNPELSDIGTCQFVLAQTVTLESALYYKVKAERGQDIIIDHGAFEFGHSTFTNEEYIAIAERVGATIVIASDVQWNCHKTYTESIKFRDWFRSEGHHKNFKLMSVIWSCGPGDFGYWFDYHKSDIDPDMFGIGKWYESMYADGSRVQLIKGLEQNFNVKPEQLHALGCPYAREVYDLRHMVRSMDTGIATKAAIAGIQLSDIDSYVKRIVSTPLEKLDVGVTYTAKKNAKYILQLANAE